MERDVRRLPARAGPADRRSRSSRSIRVADYDEYVDGKPRADGTRSFLASRGIELPEGSDDDPPGAQTVHGLGNRKNEIVLRRIREDGVEAYPGSVALRAGGPRRGPAPRGGVVQRQLP